VPAPSAVWTPTGDGPIPKSRYLSADFLRLELDHIFMRTWLLAGPLADVAQPGNYFTFELGEESVIVVRSDAGVRAFHNTCAHRGRMLREAGPGYARTFRCPYHLWEYDLDGRLQRLPEPECFAAAFAGERPRLKPVAAEAWGGFVWVNFSPDPEPLADFLGPVAARLATYRLDEYALVEDQTVDLPCNWKVGVDAFNEAYHLRAVHPQLLQMLDELHVEQELLGRHSCIRVPFGAPSPSLRDRQTVNDHLKYLLSEAGLDPASYKGTGAAVREAIQRALRQRSDLDLSGLEDAQLSDNHQYYVFPNLTLNLYATRHMLLRHRPHATDPNRMLLDQQQYARVARGSQPPPRPKLEKFAYGRGSLGFVTDQDTFNLVRVQRGMRVSGFEGLLLGENEKRIRHMHRIIDEYLSREA
jgi:phenylpropionate dioxygenase-like ring-hydroxylating dioxygenase large terminal subunit